MKTKYKLLTPLTGKAIIENNGCEKETIKFINKFGLSKIVEWTIGVEDYCCEQNGWISFFIDKKFIEENKIEVDENKIYTCYIQSLNRLHVISKNENNKFIWAEIGRSGKKVHYFDGRSYDTLAEAIGCKEALKHEVKSFDDFREATDHYFPKKEESNFDQLIEMFSDIEGDKKDKICEMIGELDLCAGIRCSDCQFD